MITYLGLQPSAYDGQLYHMYRVPTGVKTVCKLGPWAIYGTKEDAAVEYDKPSTTFHLTDCREFWDRIAGDGSVIYEELGRTSGKLRTAELHWTNRRNGDVETLFVYDTTRGKPGTLHIWKYNFKGVPEWQLY